VETVPNSNVIIVIIVIIVFIVISILDYASDIVGYDKRRRPGLSNAPLDRSP